MMSGQPGFKKITPDTTVNNNESQTVSPPAPQPSPLQTHNVFDAMRGQLAKQQAGETDSLQETQTLDGLNLTSQQQINPTPAPQGQVVSKELLERLAEQLQLSPAEMEEIEDIIHEVEIDAARLLSVVERSQTEANQQAARSCRDLTQQNGNDLKAAPIPHKFTFNEESTRTSNADKEQETYTPSSFGNR